MAFDREIVALTVYCEASNASPSERRCIVHVIKNRVKDGRFGSTMAEVCLRRYQFSEWNDDQGDNANLLRGAKASGGDPVMLDCVNAYADIESGVFDPTGNATHYHDKSIAPPKWTEHATHTLTTDKFHFYSKVP